jgi:RNA polymerase sigma factor (sigma-70 family)
MASGPFSAVLHYLRKVTVPPRAEEASDGNLLERFLGHGDESAFAALVQRHGPMVHGVCRRVLRDPHDAEDAFQATFLVLVRKAASLGRPGPLGPWLYGVAYRTALKARTEAAVRRARERPAADVPAPEADGDVVWRDLRPVLDEELNRLPGKYRVPFVLCYLEGKTNEEAAARLGCPKGTVVSRLARARQRLRGRLERRGVTLSAGTLAAVLADKASAAVPAALAEATLHSARVMAFGGAVASGVLSARVAALTEGVLRTMFLSKVKFTAALVLLLGVMGSGAGFLGFAARATDQPGGTPAAPQGKKADGPADAGKAADPAKFKGAGAEARVEALNPIPDGPKPRRVHEVMDSLTSPVNFQGFDDPATTLLEALDVLAKRYTLTFDVNEAAFAAEDVKDAGKQEIARQEREAKPIPAMTGVDLATVLRKILSRTQSQSGAVFLVRSDGVIEITTGAAANREIRRNPDDPMLPLVHADIEAQPLAAALKDLARQSGVNVVVDARAQDKAKTPVTATLLNVPVDTAVRVLADMADLRPVLLNNVLYVTTRENATRLEEEQAKRKAPLSEEKKPASKEPAPAKAKVASPAP